MPVRTRIALGTLCVFNAAIVGAVGFIFLIFVDGRAGPVAAVLMWIAAGVLATWCSIPGASTSSSRSPGLFPRSGRR